MMLPTDVHVIKYAQEHRVNAGESRAFSMETSMK